MITLIVPRWQQPPTNSITTTVDLYGHLVPVASYRARDALDKAFKAALDPTVLIFSGRHPACHRREAPT
jgi:hypothetical protein